MNTNKRTDGVSIMICCYNSASRITETLLALSKQVAIESLKWEIILIDNNSSDNTSDVAANAWSSFGNITPFRIIHVPTPGLLAARKKGYEQSLYRYVLICDDDNWLAPDYVQGMYNILSKDARIAACGGRGIPVFEIPKPYWFDHYAESYALGSQRLNEEDGKLLMLYGAGMGVNTDAIEELYNTRFEPRMSGRVKKKLTSGEDTELTYAFVMMGYKLHYAEELTFRHYLPKERLNFPYLKRIFIAFGADGPMRNLYYANVSKRPAHRTITNWNMHLLLSVYRLAKYLISPPKKYGRVIYFNWSIAYIKELVAIRPEYSSIKENISRISLHKKSIVSSNP